MTRVNSHGNPRPRLCAWLSEHNAHGLWYDQVFFLPEGEVPEGNDNSIRAEWLDEPSTPAEEVEVSEETPADVSAPKTVTFKGHSDDTFGYYWGCFGEDYDDCANHTVRVYHVVVGDQKMAVTGVYGLQCCWSVGIAPIDDDDPMPDWPMRWSFDGYSTHLEIDLPAGWEISLVWPRPGSDD